MITATNKELPKATLDQELTEGKVPCSQFMPSELLADMLVFCAIATNMAVEGAAVVVVGAGVVVLLEEGPTVVTSVIVKTFSSGKYSALYSLEYRLLKLDIMPLFLFLLANDQTLIKGYRQE